MSVSPPLLVINQIKPWLRHTKFKFLVALISLLVNTKYISITNSNN